jgi:hypothetical protein
MNQTAFFASLGAPLRNPRWSWGAVRPEDGAVFLRVWQDRMRDHLGSRFDQLTHHARYRDDPNNLGYRERLEHVELVRGGRRCYLIVCEAAEPDARPRELRQFDHTQVFPGGRVVELDGDWWIEVGPGLPVGEVRPSEAGGPA